MRILGYIPARGGSKGVPGKNKKMLGNVPLISYTIKAALSSTLLSEIYVSTDDNNIAAICIEMGIDVPRMRPAELASDNTPMLPTIQNDIAYLEAAGKQFDYIVLLQPTNPFKPITLIDNCVSTMLNANADTLFTTVEIPEKYNPHWAFEEAADGLLKLCTPDETIIPRRQQLPKAFIREGSIYIFKTSLLKQDTIYGPKIIGFPLPSESVVNIDTPTDWENAVEKLPAFLSLNPEYNF